MGAVSALRTTGGALARNPVVFAGAFIVALFGVLTQAPQFVAQAFSDPAISLLFSVLVPILAFFVSPFLTGGVLGMATEAIENRTSLGTFVRVGKARYVTLLLATLLYAVLAFAIGIALFIIGAIVALVVFGASFAGGGGDPGIGAVVALALVVLIILLVFFLFVFFLQFFSVAVVVDEAGVTESFSRSYQLVRRNLLSTLGYMVLRFLVGLAIVIPFAVLGAVAVVATGGLPSPPPSPTPDTSFASGFGLSAAVLVAGALGFLVFQTINSAVMTTYAVAFYRDRRVPDRDESAPENVQGPQRQPGD